MSRYETFTVGSIIPGNVKPQKTVQSTGNAPAVIATQGTDTIPVVTETYIAEVYIPVTQTVTGVSVLNGSLVAGNITVSMTDALGQPIAAAKSASVVAAGAAAYQQVPFATPTILDGPAKYYVLLQSNNIGYRYRSHAVGNFGASKKIAETYGTFTVIVPPTTFTTNLGPIADLY